MRDTRDVLFDDRAFVEIFRDVVGRSADHRKLLANGGEAGVDVVLRRAS
jgi:hypothetical protein